MTGGASEERLSGADGEGQDVPPQMDLESCWRKIAKQQELLRQQQQTLDLLVGEVRALRLQQDATPTGNAKVSLDDLAKVLDRKGAPPPDVYDVDYGGSFKAFLKQFEDYCVGKFSGDSRERWTGELAKFLKGELLDMFRVFGGGVVSYSNMKKKLVSHCETELEKCETRKREKYIAASLGPDETPYMYALRLEHLFTAAYPGRETEMDVELTMKFLSSVPAFIKASLERELNILKTIYATEVVEWSKIKSLLKTQSGVSMRDQTSAQAPRPIKEEPIWFTSSNVYNLSATPQANVQRPSRDRQRSGPSKTHRSRSFSQSRPRGAAGSMGPPRGFTQTGFPRPRCDYCNMPGHTEKICWRRLGCAGLPTPRCDFCDLPGHTEKICWRRLGCCLRCGSTDHRMRDCSLPLTRGSSRSQNTRPESRSPPKRGTTSNVNRARSFDQQQYLATTSLNPNSPSWSPAGNSGGRQTVGESTQWPLNH